MSLLREYSFIFCCFSYICYVNKSLVLMKNTLIHPRTVLLLICFILFLSCKKEKNNRTDPIEQETNRIDSFIINNRNVYLQEPVKFKESCIREQNQLKDSINYYRLADRISLCYYYNNQSDSAFLNWGSIINYINRQDKANNFRLKQLESRVYNDIGSVYVYSEYPDSAIHYLGKAAEVTKEVGDALMLAKIQINLASTHFEKGNYASSALNYRDALSILDTLKSEENKPLIILVNNALGRLYTDLRNFTLADYYLNNLEKELDTLEPFDKLQFLINKGHYFYTKEDFTNAQLWHQKSNDLAQSFKHENFIAVTESNLGETYLLMNQTDSAETHIKRAFEFFSSTKEYLSSLYYVEGLIASLYIQKNKLADAENILKKEYNISQFDPRYVFQHNKRLEELYEKKGDYRRAYEYRNKADFYNDSLRNITIQNNIAEIDMRYSQDTTLLRRDVVIAQKEQKVSELQSLNILAISLLVIVVLTAVLILVYIRRRKDRRYARQIATITSLRMENVRNRISPHYMFNVLNSIMPSISDQENISQPMNLLIDSIRGNLLISEKMAVTLQEETTIVKNYIALQESFTTKTPYIKWNLSDDVDENVLIPSMVIQIPVENAIKYAFDNFSPNNLISINISKVENAIKIVIKDNGRGFEPDRYIDKNRGTGSGLRILFKTIELLNSKNQQRIEFSIINMKNKPGNEHGTEVAILVPLHYKYEL